MTFPDTLSKMGNLGHGFEGELPIHDKLIQKLIGSSNKQLLNFSRNS
jgi:hypothetical protein